jgi:pSer/pThr/pTyr-binding forkhead associated (FHA) protein
MSTKRTSLLFCPPLPPVELSREAPVVIGRVAECGFTLAKNDVSRRHSEVAWTGEGFAIRDLGSTNGTFVNGARADGTQLLRAGDRIEVGSSTITFCELDRSAAPMASSDGATTVLFQRVDTREVVQGNLAQVPIFAVLQMLEMGSKSGVLQIEGPDGTARLWLENGHPRHAETEKQQGLDAAYALVALQTGSFAFSSGGDPYECSIDCSLTEILLEGSRLLDEGNGS